MNRKTIVSLILILNLVGPVFLIWADTDQGRPDNSVNYQVVSAYTDGTFNFNHPAISIARSDRTVTGGILLKGFNISGDSKINSAVLSVYYWNNINYSTSNINVNIRGVYGSPDNLDYDSIVNGVTTPASVNFNVSAFDAGEGWYNITVTDVIQQLILLPSYNQGDNFIIKTLSIPAQSPGDPAYNYQISGSVFPENHHRPILYVDYTPGAYYEGWEITPGTTGSPTGNRTYTFRDSNSSLYYWAEYADPDVVPDPISLEFEGANHSALYTAGESICITANGTYWLATNKTDRTYLELYYTPNSGISQTKIATVAGPASVSYQHYSMIYDEPYQTLHMMYVSGTDDLYYNNATITTPGKVTMAYVSPGSRCSNHGDSSGYVKIRIVYDDDYEQRYLAGAYRGNGINDYTIRAPIPDPVTNSGGFGVNFERCATGIPALNPEILYYNNSIHVGMFRNSAGEIAYLYRFDGPDWTDWADYTAIGAKALGAYFRPGDIAEGWYNSTAHSAETVVIFSNSDETGGPYLPELDIYHENGTITEHKLNMSGVQADLNGISFIYQDYGHLNAEGYPYLSVIFALWDYTTQDGPETGIYDLPISFFTDSPTRKKTEWADYLVYNMTPPHPGYGVGYLQILSWAKNNTLAIGTGTGSDPVFVPPEGSNSTCVEFYLETNYPGGYTEDQIQEAIDYCDNWIPADDDDPEGSGSWSASKKQFKLYFLLIGIALGAVPWLLFALSGDMKFIGWVIILNSLGIALLIEFMRL